MSRSGADATPEWIVVGMSRSQRFVPADGWTLSLMARTLLRRHIGDNV
jgi:hypothetical protein